jgi:ribosomal protein L29
MQVEISGIKEMMREELNSQREKNREDLLAMKVSSPT